MHRHLPLVVILLIAGLAGVLWWSAQAGPLAPQLPTHEPVAQDRQQLPVGDSPNGDSVNVETAQIERTAVTAPLGIADAAARKQKNALLRMHAIWPDKEPAAGVLLTLRWNTRERAHAVHSQVRTDTFGLAIFTGVRPGKWSLRSDRGDRDSLDVEPGEHDIRLELAGGITVTGTVVNAKRQPVGNASVWLQTSRSDWSGGSVMATTGTDGRFRLARVPRDVSLGAFARNYTRSPLLDLDIVDTSISPTEVTLQLVDKGGQLTGTVVDAAGKAIAGAIVGVGKPSRGMDTVGNRVVEKWSIRSTKTASDGRFVIEGLRPGKTNIVVRRRGFGFWRSECEVVDQQDTDLAITLERSGTLHGTITNDADQPFAGALVRCYDVAPKVPFLALGQIDFEEPLGYIATTADADGRYRLDDVTAGTTHVYAQKGGRYLNLGEPVSHATTTIDMPPGGRVEWSPKITNGNTVEGVVYYKDGHPMPNVFVTLVDSKTGKQHVLTNNEEGVFRFVNLEDSTYDIQVQVRDAPKDTLPLERTGITPNQGRVELSASWNKPVKKASGTVIGRVDDQGLRIKNINNAYVALHSKERWFRESDKLVDGTFKFESVTPCEFRLVLMEGETVLAESDWHELLPGGQLDTGVLQTVPGGHLHVTATRLAGAEACNATLYLRPPEAARSTQGKLGTGNEMLLQNITPGTYNTTIYGKGMSSIRTKVTITAGATSELAVTIHPGVLARFEVWLPPNSTMPDYSYVIRNQTGAVAQEGSGKFGARPRRPYPFAHTLPAGTYSIEFSAGTLTGRQTFAVDGAANEATVRVDVR